MRLTGIVFRSARLYVYTLLVILFVGCADDRAPEDDIGTAGPEDTLVSRGVTSDLAGAPAGDSEESGARGRTASESAVADAQAGAKTAEVVGGPPLGRYVCRQYMTTMGYLTLAPGGVYEVSGVQGRYRFDAGSGAMIWEGGSYDEWDWDGTYEHVVRAENDGRPDEHVIRIVSEADGLRINCYKMAED